MKRDLEHLSKNVYDLLIIGGGISGACACWDAALRGLSVALVEKGDFGEATSAASSKVIHGGIRYLQQGNLFLMRESLRERQILMRIAPHMVYPLPFLIPTYGHLMKGKEVLSTAMAIYDLIGFDRNRQSEPAKYIPGFKILSRDEVLELEPGISGQGLTGGILYYEGYMYDSERMTLSFLLSAAKAGAAIANYTEAISFLKEGNRIIGIKAKDHLTGEIFDIRARLILNISGPWTFQVLSRLSGYRSRHSMSFAKGIHLVTRKLTPNYALAIATRQQRVSVLDRGGRHIFFIPWRGHSLIGASNVPHQAPPDDLEVTQGDILDFVKEINQTLPSVKLKQQDIVFSFAGLYPLVDMNIKAGIYQYTGKNKIYDHKKIDGIEGLFSVIGAKYTTARSLAKRVIDLASRKLGKRPTKCRTDVASLQGGEIEQLKDFIDQAKKTKPPALQEDTLQNLIYNYGTNYIEILKYEEENPEWGEKISSVRPNLKAEIIHAVRKEMAQKLSDVVFRRTGLGTIGNPGRESLVCCAGLMAAELGWNKERVQREIEEVFSRFIIKD